MKILMLSHGYPPSISGVTVVVQKVAREMVRRGHAVTVVTASDRGVRYRGEDQGVELMRVRSAPNPFWSEARLPMLGYEELKQIVAEVQPDVINTHDSGLLSMQLYRLEHEKSHVPELLTCHYLPRYVTYYVHMGDIVDKVVEDITWEYTLRMINGFDHVIFPSRTQQQTFVEQGLAKPSSVISNGLNVCRYSPNGHDDGNVAVRYGLPPRPRILFVGRLAKDKKIDVLIRAMRQLRPAHQAYLLIVGRGDDRQRLEDLTESLNIRDSVRFLGFVPEEDLPALYRQSDLFAIASDVEVQSIPTLQAAATGLPIVAAQAGALPELVKDDTNGYLVPPHDPTAFATAIGRILEDTDRAVGFGQASLEIGRQHAEQETFHAYEKLYEAYSAAASS
jgi:1,2-diacylglycerol 3-alpha-glucosyltransferase